MIAPPAPRPGVADVYAEVTELEREVGAASERRCAPWLPRIARPAFVPSAHNLAAYLAFRERDLRGLQDRLVPLGLSSLGRCEAHVLPTIAAVRATLAAVCGTPSAAPPARGPDFRLGEWLLARRTREIFGRTQGSHIMVTLGTDAARNSRLAGDLITAGMDCARINCAHDDPAVWSAMAANVRDAARRLGRPCRIYMDLPGPKLRVAMVETTHLNHRYESGDIVQLTCAEPAVHAAVAPGAVVWIDDGKLGAVVLAATPNGLRLKITHAAPGGSKIRPGKGLNFPGTRLPIATLRETDLADLDHIVAHADIVGQSFVRTAGDIELLIAELHKRNARLPIVAKIETADAIANLPDIIVAGAGALPFGIMIARGDLALEIGFQRLVEMQEELLWLCEAAHVPVVWATQVLEHLVKDGMPSRAEFSDAALAERSDCVMLNKGPFVVEAVATLADILARMRGHQAKKSSRLRALHAWKTG